MATVQSSLERLKLQLADIATQAPEDVNDRKELLAAAKDLALALERPDDVIERVCFQPLETATIKVAVELGIFKLLVDGTAPQSAADIAKSTGADPVLIGRILRCLASWGGVKEVEDNGYAPTTVSRTFAVTRNEAALETCFDLLGPAWSKLPQFLRRLKYQNPYEPKDSTGAIAYNAPGATLFEILFSGPHLKAFGLYMGTFTMGHKQWTDLYPVETRMIEGFEGGEDSVMLVDVGGGFGHQAKLLKDTFPNIPGRLIVQDVHQMKGEDIAEIEFQAHDFYQEQPVKGARAYYLRFIMHDYDFSHNVKILTNLRKAMKPGYSRLLLNEWIIPEQKASRFMTIEDMNMMFHGGMERTEKQHRELLEAAGLKVSNIYYANDSFSESVIEAMVA